MSGGSEGAQKATLTIFVGGEPEALERARPLLEKLGTTITHFGPAGSGQAVKAVNQVMIAGVYLGVAEGLVLALKAGLDPDQVVAALGGGVAGSWVLANRSARMLANEYPLGFKTRLHLKDLGIALEPGPRARCRPAPRRARRPARERPRRPGLRRRGHVEPGARDPRPVRARVADRPRSSPREFLSGAPHAGVGHQIAPIGPIPSPARQVVA